MPPKVSSISSSPPPQQYSIVTPLLLSPPSPKGKALQHFCCSIGVGVLVVAGKMKFTKKRLIPVLVCILSFASIIRLIKIAKVTSSQALPLSPLHNPPGRRITRGGAAISSSSSALTDKEVRFLSDIVSNRAPCNLLFFGIEHQYLTLASSVNAAGLTIFLEDGPEKLRTSILNTVIISNTSAVYKIEYSTLAKDAYKLLKHAREQHCSPSSALFPESKCKLGLNKLPVEIYNTKWDVVVVDGPCGEKPDCPGRMASIYTASLLARNTTNVANVVVHDIHRTIEKWFSWEFLCHTNLVSSKGNFWNFRIPAAASAPAPPQYNATTFCPLPSIN